MERSEAVALEAWRVSKEKMASGVYGLIVLDEITYPINWGWIPVEEVVEAIRNRPPALNVIVTGRDAPSQVIDRPMIERSPP